jgi:NIPSNAP
LKPALGGGREALAESIHGEVDSAAVWSDTGCDRAPAAAFLRSAGGRKLSGCRSSVHLSPMKSALLLPLAMTLSTTLTASAADKDTRVFEMRTYYAAPGKLDALHSRFRDHTTRLFEKHGMTNVGYWTPIENAESKLIFVLAYRDRAAREASWKGFMADPDWQAAQKASEAGGPLVAKVEQLFMNATDFSPAVKPSVGAGERVFELRTYSTTPGNLPALQARFRNHTLGLFAKHGMTNLFYWQLTADQKNADNTLVYLLAHASADAAKASFDAFRKNPDWIAAKKASEDKAGGSLTVPDGVKSVFLKATDYSATR